MLFGRRYRRAIRIGDKPRITAAERCHQGARGLNIRVKDADKPRLRRHDAPVAQPPKVKAVAQGQHREMVGLRTINRQRHRLLCHDMAKATVAIDQEERPLVLHQLDIGRSVQLPCKNTVHIGGYHPHPVAVMPCQISPHQPRRNLRRPPCILPCMRQNSRRKIRQPPRINRHRSVLPQIRYPRRLSQSERPRPQPRAKKRKLQAGGSSEAEGATC